MSLFPASYSKLSTYEKCPDQAKYKYILRLPEPPRPASERGTKLHKSVEDYLLGKKTTINRELLPIVKVLKAVKKHNPAAEKHISLNRGLEKVVPYKSKEEWFRMGLDSVYAVEQTIHIPEWKSGKIYDDHLDQRQIYVIGALALYPLAKEAIATTHYIDQQGLAVPTRMDRQRAILMAWHFTERLEVMEKDKRFGPRPGFYCRWCPFSKFKGGPCHAG